MPQLRPLPALALTATAVKRALKYVAEGCITLATIKANSKDGNFFIVADINLCTRKQSAASVAFSEETWGDAMKKYMIPMSRLCSSDIDKILIAARKASKETCTHEKDEPTHNIIRSSCAHISLNYNNNESESSQAGDGNEAKKDSKDRECSGTNHLEIITNTMTTKTNLLGRRTLT